MENNLLSLPFTTLVKETTTLIPSEPINGLSMASGIILIGQILDLCNWSKIDRHFSA